MARKYTGIDVEEVKAMRERTGLGLQTCKQILFGDRMRQMLAEATTLEEVKSVLGEVIEDVYPRLER